MSGDARVKSLIDRILRLKEEQDALAADIREVYAEAKGEGYNKTAMGEVVAYLRKVEKNGKPALDEKQADFDLYLGAYERASGTALATHTHAPDRQKPVDREVRRRERFSEGMDDAKALSAEAAALGLIDPEAHAETVRLTDALANKFGAGIINREVGVITNEPEAVAEVAGDYLREPVAAEQGQIIREGDAPRETGRLGGIASSPDTDFQPPAFLTKQKTIADYRPNCLNPDACGASGLNHCFRCAKAAGEVEAA